LLKYKFINILDKYKLIKNDLLNNYLIIFDSTLSLLYNVGFNCYVLIISLMLLPNLAMNGI